jgi:hypothetical protein
MSNEAQVVRYAQLGMRLLGVMFVLEGLVGLTGSIVYAVIYAIALERSGYDPTHLDAYACGWFASSFVAAVVGFYLITDGRRLFELVFLPPSRADAPDEPEA